MGNKTIFLLIETLEKEDNLRNFEILATSFDINKLREILKNEIQDDKYDFIKKNGISHQNEDYFETNYNEGFVEYSIIENKII